MYREQSFGSTVIVDLPVPINERYNKGGVQLSQYKCDICGYIYDESAGIPENGIAPGTRWEDLPQDWVCPLCGAPKEVFVKQGEATVAAEASSSNATESAEDVKEMSPLELSALCANLARGCEKQYKAEEAALFTTLAEFFKKTAKPAADPQMDQLLERINGDLAEDFPRAKEIATQAPDRGALRALTWSEKVSRILKSLVSLYQKEGEAMLQNTGVYVCTVCGFVYLGNAAPDLCPVCKVPNWKFEKITGRS